MSASSDASSGPESRGDDPVVVGVEALHHVPHQPHLHQFVHSRRTHVREVRRAPQRVRCSQATHTAYGQVKLVAPRNKEKNKKLIDTWTAQKKKGGKEYHISAIFKMTLAFW